MSSKATKFEGLLEAVPDALRGVDHAGVIRFVNHQTELLFGYERGDLIGAPMETLAPESLQPVHKTHRGRAILRPRSPGPWEPIWSCTEGDETAPSSPWTSPCPIPTPTMAPW